MNIRKNQSGFSLLIFLVILMGLGGVALANYSQEIYKGVVSNRFERNKEVLKRAKQALLMFAYNYPQSNPGMGPGRLPCPDIDNDGRITGGGAPSILQCNAVGRLPWDDDRLGFYDARDASGERLWYAVSEEFRNDNTVDSGANSNGDDVINSDSLGTITIYDQTGSLLYDGAVAGIAAIIIAPGDALNGQDRSVANGDDPDNDIPDTDPGIIDPSNYLDAFGGFDNSSFVNSSNAIADGFRLGPVYDPVQKSIVMNDQMIIITADEVTQMAEKSVLETYRNAVDDYLANTGGVYPWLFDYMVADLDTYSGAAANLTPYPDGALTNIGRIPSIFARYFDVNNSEPFDSEVTFHLRKTFDVNGTAYALGLNATSSSVMTGVEFQDEGADDVKFSASANGGSIHSKELYFYDASPPAEDWQPCAPPVDQINGCNRAPSGAFTNGPNAFTSRILVVGIDVDFSNDMEIILDTTPAPTLSYDAPSAAYDHARIHADFSPAAIANTAELPASIYYGIGDYPAGGSFTLTDSNSQPLLDGDIENFQDHGITNQLAGNVTIGVRYFPVLPSWANSNNWHRSIMMAIAPDYLPNGSGANDCLANPPCLTVSDIGGTTNDKGYLLTIAGSVAALTDTGGPGYDTTDLAKIFDLENANLDNTFRRREGDDTVLVVQ